MIPNGPLFLPIFENHFQIPYHGSKGIVEMVRNRTCHTMQARIFLQLPILPLQVCFFFLDGVLSGQIIKDGDKFTGRQGVEVMLQPLHRLVMTEGVRRM